MHPGLTTLLLVVGAAACTYFVWHKIAPWWQRYRAYARAVGTCGYLPDPPKSRAVRFLQALSRCMTTIQVGRIKVIGSENLPATGPAVIALNHPHYIDGFVIAQVLAMPGRYMGAAWVFRLPLGIGPLLARCGGFAVDTTARKGGPARDAAVKVLCSEQQLVICPEGWAYLDGKLGPFKKGTVRIVRQAASKLGKSVPLVPVFLRYGKYPGSWIHKLPFYLGYLFLFVNAWYYRRGVTVTIGKPINSSEMSGNAEADTELLRNRVAQLDSKKA